MAYLSGISAMTPGSAITVLRALIKRLAKHDATFDEYIDKSLLVKSRDGYWFYARPRAPDLYIIAVSERYELEKWFKPRARGLVIDVGAYIGTYTVRACNKAEKVVAVEPHPANYTALKINVAMSCPRRNVVLINKALGAASGRGYLWTPLGSRGVSLTTAALKSSKQRSVRYEVEIDTLDNLLEELGLGSDAVNYLKIDVEGEAISVLQGGGRTLRRTRWLQIEMIGSEVRAHSLLKRIGFRLIDREGHNYLYSK